MSTTPMSGRDFVEFAKTEGVGIPVFIAFDSKDPNVVLIEHRNTPKPVRCPWIRIPADRIKVTSLGQTHYCIGEGGLSQCWDAIVVINKPDAANTDAVMFAELFSSLSESISRQMAEPDCDCKSHSSFSTEPIEMTPNFTIYSKCGFLPVFYAKAYSEAQLNSLLAKCNAETGNNCCWRPF